MIHPQDEQEREGPVDHITEEVGRGKGMGMQRHKERPRREAKAEG